MHCQVPGIEYTLGKRAVQTMLEGATAIALSYSGVLYIAETDEKKIHRIRQVIANDDSGQFRCEGFADHCCTE